MISPLEQTVLDSLSQKTIDFAKTLYRLSLASEKTAVVGLRSEDLLYFLQCIEQGYMPVGEHLFRSKGPDSGPHLFFTPNPESKFLAKRSPELVRFSKAHHTSSFYAACDDNNKLYGDIGKVQAIYRYLQEQQVDIPNLLQNYTSFYIEQLSESGNVRATISDRGEEFFSGVAESLDRGVVQKMIKDRNVELFELKRKFFELYLLREYVPQKVTNEDLIMFLESLSNHGSIILGFSEGLFHNYEWGTDYPFTHTEHEVGVLVPNNKLPLNASIFVGFESMGIHEDEILDYLRISG